MTSLQLDAWILLAVALAEESHGGQPRLADVLYAADSINHSVPTDDEVENSLTRLGSSGLVARSGHVVRLTDRGQKLYVASSEGPKNLFVIWESLEQLLSEPK